MLNILKADYEGKDVTDIVRSVIDRGEKRILISNKLFGDPKFGVVKKFSCTYECGSVTDTVRSEEGLTIEIPTRRGKRLGIYYTNNNHAPTIDMTLGNLQKYGIRTVTLT